MAWKPTPGETIKLLKKSETLRNWERPLYYSELQIGQEFEVVSVNEHADYRFGDELFRGYVQVKTNFNISWLPLSHVGPKDTAIPTANQCTCEIGLLMRSGCCCGMFEKEKL